MLTHQLLTITERCGYHYPPSFRGRNWSTKITGVCPQSLQASVTKLVPHPDRRGPEPTLFASTLPSPRCIPRAIAAFLIHMQWLSRLLCHTNRSYGRWISTYNIHALLGSTIEPWAELVGVQCHILNQMKFLSFLQITHTPLLLFPWGWWAVTDNKSKGWLIWPPKWSPQPGSS